MLELLALSNAADATMLAIFACEKAKIDVVFIVFARLKALFKVVRIEVLLTTISVFTFKVPKILVPSLSNAI
jgi:hypothetical protein